MTESRYTPELVESILHRLSNGDTLRSICRDEGIPESSFRTWVHTDRDGLGARYARARALQIDCLADEVLTVAYRSDLDPAERRVITENLRWLLSKLRPERFGDRLLVAGDPENPIQHLHTQINLAELSPDALDALEHFLLHVTDRRAVGVDAMALEHDPTHVSIEHDVRERPAALLRASR